MRVKASIAIVGLAVVIVLFLFVFVRRDVVPEVYSIKSTDPSARPCSARAEAQIFELDLSAGGGGNDLLARFGVKKGWGAKENLSVVSSPDGVGQAIQVQYAAGATSPSTQDPPVAGASFYSPAGFDGSQTTACLRYSVYFPDDFDFVRGGKLPGLYGGDRPPSGGARPKGDDGFTLRLMWRSNGQGELYGYFLNMLPDSNRGGDQIGTGSWTFKRGAWTQIEIEAELNDVGASNGLVRIWVNETPTLFVRNIKYRKSEALGIGGFIFSTFFGGQSERFAPSKDQVIYFKGIESFR